jgi:hypothetical protein
MNKSIACLLLVAAGCNQQGRYVPVVVSRQSMQNVRMPGDGLMASGDPKLLTITDIYSFDTWTGTHRPSQQEQIPARK